MRFLEDSGRDCDDAVAQLSRRGAILRAVAAMVAGSGALMLSEMPAFGAEQIAGGASDRPYSNDVEIIPWGERHDGASTIYVSQAVPIEGCFLDAVLTSGIAWGNGHDGKDVWASDPKLVGGNSYKLDFTGILPHPGTPGCYFFVVKLEVGDSASDRITAMFRYRKPSGLHGVIATGFMFPKHATSLSRP